MSEYIDTNTSKKTIIWLEDNPQEATLQFIQKHIAEQHQDIRLRKAKGVAFLKKHLGEASKEKEEIIGVILDMLIYGSNDLSPFNMNHISWDEDTPNVGEVILEHIFRNEHHPELMYLSELPVLILTVKQNITKKKLSRFIKVCVIHKYDDSDSDWSKKVTEWIDKL